MIVEEGLGQWFRGRCGPLLALVAALVAAAGSMVVGAGGDSHLVGRVTRVVDGDTIVVAGVGEVRYLGIDTPELHHPRQPIQRLARRALRANERLVLGRVVTLRTDRERRDRYGRLLAYVYVGDSMVNAALMRAGWARPLAIAPNLAHAERFAGLYRRARATRVGLWGSLEGGPPWGRL